MCLTLLTIGANFSFLYSLYVQVEKILCCQKSLDLISRYDDMAILLPRLDKSLSGLIFPTLSCLEKVDLEAY